ncbi:MAG: cupin domain-containing protein [Dysgonamonadaceae bacterium]|nr:cupin domain-containing protein [Dysgonamonadaceae bacterium]MDD4728084.1 cupin domain-containing protein [Dysgonamonadaceae bacterium]
MKKKLVYLIPLLLIGLLTSSCVQTDQNKPVELSQNDVNEKDILELEYKDFGNDPFVFNIEDYTKQNDTYRTTLWTGEYMQLTVMSILPGEDIGLEVHLDHDQFIRVEEGEGIVQMGDAEDDLSFEKKIEDDFAIMIPAGKWHNVINDSDKPLKLYSIYAPREHEFDTVHKTREESMADEHDH